MDFIDGDFFERLGKDIFYCETHEIDKKIDSFSGDYILTHNSDSCLEYIGNDKLKLSLTLTHWSADAEKKLGSRYKIFDVPKNVKKWFGQNLISNGDERFIPIPIGVERKRWSNGQKHKILSQKITHKNNNRKYQVYINFKDRNHKSRKSLKKEFNNIKGVKIINGECTFNDYCNDILNSKYVLSPTGNGYDCHRTWESLYLGAIPIIESNDYYEKLYSDMSVLLVDSFLDITTELLEEKYDILKEKEIEKIKPQYWENLIKK